MNTAVARSIYLSKVGVFFRQLDQTFVSQQAVSNLDVHQCYPCTWAVLTLGVCGRNWEIIGKGCMKPARIWLEAVSRLEPMPR